MQPGKTLWLLKIHPGLPDLEALLYNLWLFFQKIFSLASLSINIIFQFSSLIMLGKFTIFRLLFIIMYILVHCIDLGIWTTLYMKSVKIKVFFHTWLLLEKISENL